MAVVVVFAVLIFSPPCTCTLGRQEGGRPGPSLAAAMAALPSRREPKEGILRMMQCCRLVGGVCGMWGSPLRGVLFLR